MNNVVITKGTPQTVIAGNTDSISGLIAGAVAVATKFVLGTAYTLYRPSDAVLLGIDADYDTTNKVRLYHHIEEFYRLAGEGTKLYLMGVAQSETMVNIADTDNEFAQKLIREANGEIRQLAIALNPAEGYTVVTEQGLNADVLRAIPVAQGLAEQAYSDGRPCQILLEGRDYAGPAASAADLGALVIDTAAIEAPKVSIVIGQDYQYAATLDAIGQKYASVGLALGCVARIPVHYNIGEVGTMDLTDTGKSKMLDAGLANHTKVLANEGEIDTLHAKRYILVYRERGTSGFRWNNDYTAVAEKVDIQTNVMNENTIAYGRTMDKAMRILTTAYAPLIKKVFRVDATTGLLGTGQIKDIEGIGLAALETMSREISGYSVTVDPTSDLLTGDRELRIDFDVVPFGTVNKITGTLNLKTKL